jgi:hypothetical protein
MELLTAADFDTANILLNIGLAGAALLGVYFMRFGWRFITSFFR